MRQTRLLSVVGLSVALLMPVLVQAAPPVGRAQALEARTSRLSTVDLRLSIERVLIARRVPAATIQSFGDRLRAKPIALQEALAAALDPSVAERVGRPELSIGHSSDLIRGRIDPGLIRILLTPGVETTIPAGSGGRGDYCFVTGSQFTADCEVLLDGAPAAVSDWITSGLMAFKMAADAPLGHVYQLTVHNKATNTTSSALTIKAIAPRGYRGVHGLSFPNFGAAVIPWSVYVFVFGQANVEFANGTHRPSAQSWYDSTFKSVGTNGNCWGMSQLSLRLRDYFVESHPNALNRVCNSAWVISHLSGTAWSLPWDENSKQAVQSLQCLQLVTPMATYCDTIKANQTNKTAWDFAKLFATSGNPVQNTLFGHAVVTSQVEAVGNDHKFCFYDNNNPYSETETSGSDPNHGVTNWTSGSFAYGGYTQTRCYEFNQLTGIPSLPAGIGGDGSVEGAAETAPVRFEVPRVAGLLVQDEAGRGGADGAGVPGLAEVTPDMGLGPIPATFPRIFLLSAAQGRSLSFTVPNQARQPLKLACYSRGGTALVTLNGANIRASFSQLDRANAQISLPDPQGAGLQELQFIAPISLTEERQVIADSFSGLGSRAVGASLSPDRSAVEILNSAGAQPLRLRLRLERFLPAGGVSLPAVQQTVAAGQLHLLGPTNWATLQTGQLRSLPRPLPANRLQTR